MFVYLLRGIGCSGLSACYPFMHPGHVELLEAEELSRGNTLVAAKDHCM